ncbi:MAG: hypothetical protein WC043_10685 [Pseudobdellovibrionaceae bacterium]
MRNNRPMSNQPTQLYASNPQNNAVILVSVVVVLLLSMALRVLA